VGAKKNVPKCELFESIFPCTSKNQIVNKHLWAKRSCWGRNIKLEFVIKTWAHIKKTFYVSFPSCLLKYAWVEPTFPYALLPCHKEVKQNIIKVIRGASAKLPHHRGLVLAHPMENKMPFVYHVV